MEREMQSAIGQSRRRLRKISALMAGLAAEGSATSSRLVKMHTPSIGRAAQTNSARRKPATSGSGASDFARHVGTISPPATEQALELAATASLTAMIRVENGRQPYSDAQISKTMSPASRPRLSLCNTGHSNPATISTTTPKMISHWH